MDIIVGKYSGFCNGVNYTVTMAKGKLIKNNVIYSLGDIVHNEEVINELKGLGLIVVNSIMDIPNDANVIIRAHGESIDTYSKLKEKNANIIDLTCGKVKLIHTKILKHQENSFIIIIGKKNHPETIAHKSFSNHSYVIENKSDIIMAYQSFLKLGLEKVYIVSQTTFNEILFDDLVSKIKKVFNNALIEVDNTICNTTSIRQKEVMDISKKVDKMIIIGGKNSSNTKELAAIANNYCKMVYLIQTYHDLKNISFSESDIIGIEAGASTPNRVINEVVEYIRSIYKKVK